MPVIKIIPSRSRLSRIEAYLKNPSKTDQKYYFGNLCDYDNVTQSFNMWNDCFYSKANKRTYYHIIVSFNPKDKISTEQCKKMVEELCEKTSLNDYPYFGTLHIDTDHLHAHIIVNNNSIYGKSYQSTRSSTRELKVVANEICARESFVHSLIDVDKKAKQRLTTAEAQIILKKKQMPWKEELRYQIEDVLQMSSSLKDFKTNMRNKYEVNVSENKKGELRFHSPGVAKPCPAKRLGDAYSKENIEKKLQENIYKITKGIKR